MDIIRFHNPTNPTKFERGEIINGLRSKMWIERYAAGGEFTLVGPVDRGLREKLPVGSFISHLDTSEVMIIEDHEINDDAGSETEVKITGRGFESYFEQRIVGMNKNYPTVTTPSDYIIPAAYTWNQAVTLISDHILAANLIDDNNALSFVSVVTNVAGTSVSEARTIKLGELYSELLNLLAIDDLGIKIFRPGPSSPLGAASPNLAIQIHIGVDRTGQVVFSYESGEIESADYLWSNRNLKNAALVSSRWLETVVIPPGVVGYDRRWMLVDASDLDSALNSAPSVGASRDAMIARMQQRGLQALAAQNTLAITKAEVSKRAVKAKYRTDYDVGDYITVEGDYNETSFMRVTEYVEIDDETGISGYPTLTMIE